MSHHKRYHPVSEHRLIRYQVVALPLRHLPKGRDTTIASARN